MSFTILPSSLTAFSFTNRFASFPDFTIPDRVINWVIEIRSGQSFALISIVGSLEDTIAGFEGILKGDYDHLPEAAFYLVGTIEEAVEKGKQLAQEAA